MHQEYIMGNEAIGLGALAAGVDLVAGYPGTPSTEVLETVAKRRTKDTYVEWSVNEKTALETGAGAAYTGARVLITMKQVGLNVASDPLMCLEYVGIEGAMVVLVADDPGPMSSQTEQDTRTFASYSKIPCFDPSSVEEAYEMIQEAFALSEKLKSPVLFRPTTRVDHGYASVTVKDEEEYTAHNEKHFVKDTNRWVIFPKLSFAAHGKIEKRNAILASDFSSYPRNRILNADCTEKKGIATGGISFTYTEEAENVLGALKTLKVSTPYPFPDELALSFLNGLDEVLCIEELDPVIEDALVRVCGKYHLNTKIFGKRTGHTNFAGENTIDLAKSFISTFTGRPLPKEEELPAAPPLPVRPPVLCAGCPHRASFYAVKQAMKGRKTIYCGDIGCYTLGNAAPLDMTDTCLCMGAGLGIAQGVYRMEPDTKCFAFVGDSTFFASAVPGVINAFYNQAEMTLIVLDNSTTAMTGHQPHPGTGRTMMGDIVEKISIENILRGIGLTDVATVNPLEHEKAVETVKEFADKPGVKAIIFKYPCIALSTPESGPVHVDTDTCIGCMKCIREIGCPALSKKDGKAVSDPSLCTGCGLCTQICPVHAIKGGADE